MNLTNIETIKQLARQHHLRPSALVGQNFLVDKNVLDSIIAKADIKSDDVILEIGPGFGVLTQELMARAGRVVAVERDKVLFRYLNKQFVQAKNLVLVNADILGLDIPGLKTRVNFDRYRITANIPYGITGKIISRFVSGPGPKPDDMLVLVQKEVGKRICAQAGKMSLLALAVQLYGEPKIELPVPRTSFWPAPKVDSVLLRVAEIKAEPRYPIADERFFWRIARVGFSAPRKQLHNNLAALLRLSSPEVREVLGRANLGEKVRAQELEIKQWIKLASELAKKLD